MRGLSDIISAAQTGALNSQVDYSKWSGGMGVANSGIEHFVSARIAEEIYNKCNNIRKLYVGLEYPVQGILANIERKVRGRKGGRLDDDGRVDVIVWDAGKRPRVVIEVKRHFRWSAVEHDADRLFRLVSKFGTQHDGGSIEAGLIVIPFIKWTKEGRETVYPTENTILNFRESAESMGFKMEKIVEEKLQGDDEYRYPSNVLEDEKYDGVENLQYCSACFTLRAKNLSV